MKINHLEHALFFNFTFTLEQQEQVCKPHAKRSIKRVFYHFNIILRYKDSELKLVLGDDSMRRTRPVRMKHPVAVD